MSTQLYPARPLERTSAARIWLDRLFQLFLVVGLGVLIGQQYMSPDKRIIQVAAAAIVVGVAWRLDMVSALGVLILMLPFPRGTTFGNTNFAFILMLLVIYLLRLSQREVPRPERSPTDGPVLAFLLIVIVSFYNIPNMRHLGFALQQFQLFLGTLLLFFLIQQNVRSVKDFKRMLFFQTMVILILGLVAIWELDHPRGKLVPGWIEFTATVSDDFSKKNLRVGVTFYDFELLADFCGLNLLFLTFLYMRSKSVAGKVFHAGMLLLTLFVLFSTVTRGPLVSLSVALTYVVWVMRRQIKIVPFTVVVCIILASFFAMNYYVANFTHSGDLFARMEHTEMVGWMPDSRAGAWTDAWTRAWEHPLIGHGPYYSAERGGLKFWYWPHNLYLYVANNVGFIGLAIFLVLLHSFWRITRSRATTFSDPNFIESYLFMARAQLVFFLVDQFKIEYWRNPNYQFQVWLMFAFWVAAERLARQQRAGLIPVSSED